MIGSAVGALLFVSPAGPAQAAVSIVAQTQQAPAPLADAVPLATAAAVPAANAALPVEGEEVQTVEVTARRHHPHEDPLEGVNKLSFSLTQHFDDAITAPATSAYTHVVPKPVRSGLRNFFRNLREPVVFLNFMLQLKPGKAIETVGRFAINTTLGLGGVIDVAKRCPFNLPLRQNRFSDTLGFYGVKPGPFLYVPLAGPTTVRDVAGGLVDFIASPFMLGGVFRSRAYVISSAAIRVVDRRDQKEDMLRSVRDSEDPYATRRNIYLHRQQERIDALHGLEPEQAQPQRCRRTPAPEPAPASPPTVPVPAAPPPLTAPEPAAPPPPTASEPAAQPAHG